MTNWLYATGIFVGSFLLFQIQPMIAKMILPWFGGSAAVWITCMLFFQCALLLGYLYAHLLAQRLGVRSQALVHVLLAAGGLLLLPVGPAPSWKPLGPEDPILHILALLAASIGLPYVVLSATSPLLQAWYARRNAAGLPYRLFALSNLASLLGLVAYPFLVEPNLTLGAQSRLWSAGYALFVLLTLAAAAAGLRRGGAAPLPAPEGPVAGPEPTAADRALWLAWSGCGVVLLLSVTNHLTQNVAPVPFLWILPLGLYLLSFILCFNLEQAYIRSIYLGPIAIVLVGMSFAILRYNSTTPLGLVLGVFSACLFGGCMFCHGELSRRKPSPRHLTGYYLMIALGGALGGVLVGVAAPLLFRGTLELPLAVAACAALLVFVHRREGRANLALAAATGLVVATVMAWHVYDYGSDAVAMGRNFYGSLRVKLSNAGTDYESRVLVHGTVAHGVQFTDPSLRAVTTAYYGPASGAALALKSLGERPLRVGLVGLGVGTLAAYSRPGDVYRFYEINPMVETFARSEFTFLADAAATVAVVPGDARLALEREADQRYDVLVVDAFSGDAVPAHLLTIEAMRLYFRHLAPEGVLALHLSNNHLDLIPVADALVRALGKHALLVDSEPEQEEVFGAKWVLVASAPLQAPEIVAAAEALWSRPGLRAWTDDYSNLFEILKPRM
jgi:spermidine synthase